MSVIERKNFSSRSDFFVLYRAELLFHGCFGLLLAALPKDLLNSGATSIELGWIVGAYALGGFACRIFFQRLFQTTDLAKLFLLSRAILVASAVMPLLSGSLFTLFLSRFFLGVSLALLFTTSAIWIAENVKESAQGRALGLMGTTAGIGLVLFPFIGLMVYDHSGMFSVYAVCLFFSLMASFVGIHSSARSISTTCSSTSELTIMPLLFTLLLAGGSLGCLQAFLPVLIEVYAVENTITLYIGFGFSLVLGRLIGGELYDRFGFFGAALVGGFLLTLSVLFVGYKLGVGTWIYVSCGVYGVGFGITATTFFVYIFRLTSTNKKQGSVIGYSNLALDLGVATGPVVLGVFLSGAGEEFRLIADAFQYLGWMIFGAIVFVNIFEAYRTHSNNIILQDGRQ